jgi:diaminohydroxyphosphoribosylaminopyrimidine deaminase/5-amino-6-(5-phosphoribosylamino)uracil reductase
MTNDEALIARCIGLAKKGAGFVSPNPMVGCIITKNNRVIAEGWHKQYGGAHAEINAINSALKKGFNLKGAVMYVSLEPCVHYSKTPPCVDKIIEHKIGKVVIGIKDPYMLVAGKGIKKLKENNIEVITGVLQDECRELNKFFFKHVKTGLPYITLKSAQTLDGKIADSKLKSKWISSPESRKLVHKLRSEYDAVLVGRNTVMHDNPRLTVRLVKGRNPYRIIIDKDLKSVLNRHVFSDRDRDKTIVLASHKVDRKKLRELNKRKITVIFSPVKNGKIDLRYSLKQLAAFGISSILVEGGAGTYSGFLSQKLADEIMLFTAPKIMGNGISAFQLNMKLDFSHAKEMSYELTGTDILTTIKLQ